MQSGNVDYVSVKNSINRFFFYSTTLMNFGAGTIDTLQVKSMLEPNIVNFIKTNPQMKQIRDEKVTINYY